MVVFTTDRTGSWETTRPTRYSQRITTTQGSPACFLLVLACEEKKKSESESDTPTPNKGLYQIWFMKTESLVGKAGGDSVCGKMSRLQSNIAG